MKKLLLPIFLVFASLFFLPQGAGAQTRQECEKTRARASYDCLTGRTKCIYSCTGDVSACYKTCSQSNDACEKQVEADYQVCLGTIKKDSENPPKTEASPEVKINTDCHEAFNKESNSCLKESTKCLSSCVDKANEVMSLTVDGGKVNLECQRNVCDPASEACDNKAKANFKSCLDARKAGQDSQQKDKPKEEEFSLLKFFGVNPFETWLRVKSFGEAGEGVARAMDGLFFAASSIDIDYGDGMTRIEVDDTSMFGTDLTMRAGGQIDGVQIKLPGKQDYNDLQPHQKIPDDAIIKINTPSRFYIGEDDKDFEVRSVSEGEPLEFQVKKSKENASVDLIELQSVNKMSVKLGRVLDKKIDKPSITPDVEEKAWGFLTEKETLVDVPGTDNVKIYSWGADSGAVIKSSDWQQTEIKKSAGSGGDFITREVQFKQKDVEVKVRNEGVPKVRFGVKSPDFLEAVSSRTHYLVSYDKDTKQNTVVVYEGKVEVKTNDGKTIVVEPEDGNPGMVVVTKKLSVVKTAIVGLGVVGIIGGAIWFIKRRSPLKPFKNKSK